MYQTSTTDAKLISWLTLLICRSEVLDNESDQKETEKSHFTFIQRLENEQKDHANYIDNFLTRFTVGDNKTIYFISLSLLQGG